MPNDPTSRAVRAAHAAYALDASESEWLQGVLDAAGSALNRERGVVAFRWRYTPGEPLDFGPLHVFGTRDDDPSLFRSLLSNLDARRIQLAYGTPYRFRALSEIARAHPTLANVRDDRDMQAFAHGRELLDFEMLRVGDAGRTGWMFSVLKRVVAPIHPRRRAVWQRVSAHIEAGARLRERLSGSEVGDADAIFDPTTGTLDVQDDALASRARRERLYALLAARAHGVTMPESESLEAMELWHALELGRWSVVDRTDSDGRRFTVLHRNPPATHGPLRLSERERHVAWRVGRGQHIKLVAYDLGIAPSTVRNTLRNALAKLGLRDRAALIRLLANVINGSNPVELREWGVAGVEEVPPRIPCHLSEAESDIARRIFWGQGNEEIAVARGTSTRTVANQVQHIFDALHVNSRDELMVRLHPDGDASCDTAADTK